MFVEHEDYDSILRYQYPLQRQGSYRKRLIDCNVQCDIWKTKPKPRSTVWDIQIDSQVYGCSIYKGRFMEKKQQRRVQIAEQQKLFYSQPIQSNYNSVTYFQQSNTFQNGLERILENTYYQDSKVDHAQIKQQIKAAKPQIMRSNIQLRSQQKHYEQIQQPKLKKQKTKKKVESQIQISSEIEKVMQSGLQDKPTTVIFVKNLNYVQNNFSAQIDKLTPHYLNNIFGVWLLEVYPDKTIKKLQDICKEFNYQEKQYFNVNERRFMLECIYRTVDKYRDLQSYVGKSLKDKKIPKQIKEWNQNPAITSNQSIAKLGKKIILDLKNQASQLYEICQNNYESKNFKKAQRQQAMDFIKQMAASIRKYRKQEADSRINQTNFFEKQILQFIS